MDGDIDADRHTLLAAAAQVADRWAERGGGGTEYSIAVDGGEVQAIVEFGPTRKLGPTNRRGVLGAIAQATLCDVVGYVTDATSTTDGATNEALLCLELRVVDLGAKIAGAAAHLAPYSRETRRLGRDRISMQPFVQVDNAEFGEFATEVMRFWVEPDGPRRLAAMELLRKARVELTDLHPDQQAAFAALVAG